MSGWVDISKRRPISKFGNFRFKVSTHQQTLGRSKTSLHTHISILKFSWLRASSPPLMTDTPSTKAARAHVPMDAKIKDMSEEKQAQLFTLLMDHLPRNVLGPILKTKIENNAHTVDFCEGCVSMNMEIKMYDEGSSVCITFKFVTPDVDGQVCMKNINLVSLMNFLKQDNIDKDNNEVMGQTGSISYEVDDVHGEIDFGTMIISTRDSTLNIPIASFRDMFKNEVLGCM